MRRYLGIISIAALVIAVLIGLSAAGTMEFDRPAETETAPNRSSYNSGPTGTRAFYQLLEESASPVERWIEDYDQLNEKAREAAFVVVGPFRFDSWVSNKEANQLQEWVSTGGQLLIVSRFPRAQFRDDVIHAKYKEKLPQGDMPAHQVERILAGDAATLQAQPTDLMRGVVDPALSHYAARMNFYVDAPPPPPSGDAAPSPAPSASPSPSPTETPEDETPAPATLFAPIFHLGDAEGTVLAEFRYGQGRVFLLSDPFVIANNGISRGSNLTLALNLVRAIGQGENGKSRRIFFDEYHHGYRREGNPLIAYFRGTPMPWLLLQGALLGALMLYTYGRRFARPLPLPQVDRHSPLEFVGSMANLQQAAAARDLAIENIYPRFKAQLCRRLGLSSRASAAEILECARHRPGEIREEDLRQALTVSEAALRGEPIDDAQLMQAVRLMRRTLAALGRPGRRPSLP